MAGPTPTQPTDAAQAVFAEVFAAEGDERRRELDRLCGNDRGLRAAVMELLASYDEARREGFLESPYIRAGFDLRDEPADADLAAPATIGRYDVTGRLGMGASGVVYRAEAPPPTRRPVAIKLLRRGATESALTRFRLEQQALASLNHPGIAQIFESGFCDSGELYAVFELVEGPTLTQFVRQGSSDWRDRIALVVQVCEAVQHAHQQGVIHRDLKPENLLVSIIGGRPQVKVIDFGVSKLIHDQSTMVTTQHGRLVGTFAYMAPELLSGTGAADTRVDVYALGVILFETLAGRHPHQPHLNSLPQLTRAVISGRVPALEDTRIGRRADIGAVIRAATHPDPERRYPTPQHLADDLRRILAGRPVEARRPSLAYAATRFAARHPRSVAVTGLCLAIIAALLLSVVSAGRRAADERATLHDTLATLADDVLSELAEKSGTSESRLRLARLLDRRLEDLRRGGADSRELLQRHALVLDALGDALVEHSQWDEAGAVRRRVLDLLRTLLSDRPDDRDLQRESARALVKIGDTARPTAGPAAAGAWYDQAHVIIAALAEQYPEDQPLQDDLCWSLERRGWVLMSLNFLNDAEAMATERLELARRLLDLRPGDTVAMHNMASAHCHLSEVYEWQCRPELALEQAQQALPHAERLSAAEPGRISYELQAINAERAYIRGLVGVGEMERAKERFAHLCTRADRLAQLNPLNPQVMRVVQNIRNTYWAECGGEEGSEGVRE